MELREETYVTAKVDGRKISGSIYVREDGRRVIYDNDEDRLYLLESATDTKVDGRWTLKEAEDLAKEGIEAAADRYDWKKMSQDPSFDSLRQKAKDAAVAGASEFGMTEDEAGKMFDDASAARAVEDAAGDAEQGRPDEAIEELEKFKKDPMQEATRLFVVGKLSEKALESVKNAVLERDRRQPMEKIKMNEGKKRVVRSSLFERAAREASDYAGSVLDKKRFRESSDDDDFDDDSFNPYDDEEMERDWECGRALADEAFDTISSGGSQQDFEEKAYEIFDDFGFVASSADIDAAWREAEELFKEEGER